MYINKGAAKTGSALQLVDKVDKLLDGDAGSRRLTDVRLVPSVPASPTPALEPCRKHTCFRQGFANKECLRGTCPRKHRSVTRLLFFHFPNDGFPFSTVSSAAVFRRRIFHPIFSPRPLDKIRVLLYNL